MKEPEGTAYLVPLEVWTARREMAAVAECIRDMREGLRQTTEAYRLLLSAIDEAEKKVGELDERHNPNTEVGLSGWDAARAAPSPFKKPSS